MRKIFTWYYLLNKRTLKNYSYIVLFLLLPLLALSLKIISLRDSSVLKVGLYTDANSGLSKDIIKEFIKEDSIINFIEYKDEESAYEDLQAKLDALWILPDDLAEAINNNLYKKKCVVKVIEARKSSILGISREKLFAKLYPYISKALYKKYMEEKFPYLKDNKEGEEELDAYYEARKIDDDTIEFVSLDKDGYIEKKTDKSFILSPLRGFLAIWLFLVAMISAMFYKKDIDAGLWVWIDRRLKSAFSFLYILAITSTAALIMLVAIYVSGLGIALYKEVVSLFFYVIALALVSNILRAIFNNIYIYSAFIPVILIVSVILSPIFIDLSRPLLQCTVPVYHYINSIHTLSGLYKMFAYIGILVPLHLILVRS
jgi:membrane protein